jgi:hypothetical protein
LAGQFPGAGVLYQRADARFATEQRTARKFNERCCIIIYASASKVDQKTMTLQYFETLKSMGMSPSTKYIFPMEFTSMLDNFLGKK